MKQFDHRPRAYTAKGSKLRPLHDGPTGAMSRPYRLNFKLIEYVWPDVGRSRYAICELEEFKPTILLNS